MKLFRGLERAALGTAVLFTCASAFGYSTHPLRAVQEAAQAIKSARVSNDKASSGGQIEMAFSSDGPSEALIVKVIGSAKRSIRLAAYSFTSPVIVRALLDATRRGGGRRGGRSQEQRQRRQVRR